MTRISLGLATLITASLIVSGCATTDIPPTSDSTPTNGTQVDAPGDDNGSSSTGAVLGTVIVDGVSYDITELRNCEPLDDGPVERALELQGLGVRDGDRYQIDVYVQTVGGAPLNDVAWAGPEGIYGGPDNAEITYTGDRVRGAATLLDAMSHTEAIAVEFDLEVPDTTIACR